MMTKSKGQSANLKMNEQQTSVNITTLLNLDVWFVIFEFLGFRKYLPFVALSKTGRYLRDCVSVCFEIQYRKSPDPIFRPWDSIRLNRSNWIILNIEKSEIYEKGSAELIKWAVDEGIWCSTKTLTMYANIVRIGDLKTFQKFYHVCLKDFSGNIELFSYSSCGCTLFETTIIQDQIRMFEWLIKRLKFWHLNVYLFIRHYKRPHFLQLMFDSNLMTDAGNYMEKFDFSYFAEFECFNNTVHQRLKRLRSTHFIKDIFTNAIRGGNKELIKIIFSERIYDQTKEIARGWFRTFNKDLLLLEWVESKRWWNYRGPLLSEDNTGEDDKDIRDFVFWTTNSTERRYNHHARKVKYKVSF